MRIFIAASIFLIANVGVTAESKPAKAVQCEACHGANGAAPIMGNYPKINGQNKDYLISALKDYRDGKRKGALSAVMTSQAQLTDAEIEELASYYAGQ